MSTYNINKLTSELNNAEIPIHGCASDGRIDFKDEATEEQKALAETIKTNHNPIWYVEQRRNAYPPIAEQLDMMYWDVFKNTNEWIDTIAAIKAKYPKE
jgi:hypothetical protein